jgi:hypothetical protein
MTGVFNPYDRDRTAKKKKFLSPMDPMNPADTEQAPRPKNSIRLDGDSYILQFDDAELDEINERLEVLLKDVVKEHAVALSDAGVSFMVKPQKPTLVSGQLQLETNTGYIIVYAGEGGKEVDCFRRLAYALYLLPIKNILAKHSAKVYKRG